MDPGIRRVQPEAGIQSGAVRRVGPRRQRGSNPEQEFADELARETGEAATDETTTDEDPRDADLTVAPPDEDEAGTRIDLVG